MSKHIKIVLFEDTAETQSNVLTALKKHLKRAGTVLPFEGFRESTGKNRMFEDRIESILNTRPFQRTTLIVADRDLSKSVAADFRGLSVSAVAAAADRLAIPICAYARHTEPDNYDWRARWEEGFIVLSLREGPDELARRAVMAARGFAEILSKLPQVRRKKTNMSPARMLAALLGKPEYADKIALYAVGDPNRVAEVRPRSMARGDEQIRRHARFLGYWLWDCLLRYPGLVVNEVAASSYLNLSESDFADSKVRSLFDAALYLGPFSDPQNPRWWRGMLDDIVSGENVGSGLEFARKKVKRTAKGSQCYVDPRRAAGYYCVIERKPVSLENSKGGLSWLPRGADLARVGTPRLDEYAPWLGA